MAEINKAFEIENIDSEYKYDETKFNKYVEDRKKLRKKIKDLESEIRKKNSKLLSDKLRLEKLNFYLDRFCKHNYVGDNIMKECTICGDIKSLMKYL